MTESSASPPPRLWRSRRCRWLRHSCMRFIVRSVRRVVQAIFL